MLKLKELFYLLTGKTLDVLGNLFGISILLSFTLMGVGSTIFLVKWILTMLGVM